MKGEFVGGCDIMLSHYRDGELKKMLEECKAIESQE
jgi:glutaredoxin-related protein